MSTPASPWPEPAPTAIFRLAQTCRECLTALDSLLEAYRSKDLRFPARSLAWLRDSSQRLRPLGFSGCYRLDLLALRVLQAAEDPSLRPAPRRREARSTTLDAVLCAEALLRQQLNAIEGHLGRQEGRLLQAIQQAAEARCLIPPDNLDPETWLAANWVTLLQLPKTRATALHAAGTLAGADRQFVLQSLLDGLVAS